MESINNKINNETESKLKNEMESNELKELPKHIERLKKVFQEVELINKHEKLLDVYNLAKAYYKDAIFFKQKGELLKALERESYCWGLLDALAIIKALKVPKQLQPWFKTEFDEL